MTRPIAFAAPATPAVPPPAGAIPGFACGTRLLTPNGYVPVEAFKPGDPIITRLGIRRAVRRIGQRSVEIGLQMNAAARPVIVLPGAFGPGLPGRGVRLSPGQEVVIDGVAAPVLLLVNGAMILREDRPGHVTYFDIALDRRDTLMAEGLPLASAGADPSGAPVAAAELVRIRRRLQDIVLQAGFTLTRQAALHGIVREARLEPEMRLAGARWLARFRLNPDTRRILLLAPSAAPAATDPQSEDRRELSICLRQSRTKHLRLALGEGWHARAPGDPGIWMSGCGEIFLPPGVTELTLHLTASAQRWMRAAGG